MKSEMLFFIKNKKNPDTNVGATCISISDEWNQDCPFPRKPIKPYSFKNHKTYSKVKLYYNFCD